MINQRMCVACKTRKIKSDLTRICGVDGNAVVDDQKMQTGRAIYVCKNEHCVDKLKKSNAIHRLLKSTADEQFYKKLI